MERVTITQIPEQEPNHEAEMIAKAEAGTGMKPDNLIAGKYKTEEELGKGVLELLKKQHGDLAEYYKTLEKGIGQKQEQPAQEPKQETQLDATEAVSNAGFDINEFANEVIQTGGLSEDSYKKLEAAGFPRTLVDNYIEGQRAIGEKIIRTVYERAGGEQQYNSMINWARTGLTPAEIEAFDSVLDTNDPVKIGLAVDGLRARYESAFGRDPKLIDGKVASEPAGFESWAEVTAAMKDPRYFKDPAYNRMVQQKLARSNL